jgi:hypothetical protein
MKLLFVHFCHLQFWRRRFSKDLAIFEVFWALFDLEMKVKVKFYA